MQMLMKTDGIATVAQGAMAGSLVYLFVALIVKHAGKDWINKVLPPIVVGPIILVIGLVLRIMQSLTTLNNSYSGYALLISMVTLFAVILFNMYGRRSNRCDPNFTWINCGLYFLIGSWFADRT